MAGRFQGFAAHVDLVPGIGAEQVFQQERDTFERPVGQIGRVRLGTGFVVARADHGVELGVELLHPRNGRIDQLAGTGLAAADQFGLGRRVQRGEIVRHGASSSCFAYGS